jgi:hypothetical protein
MFPTTLAFGDHQNISEQENFESGGTIQDSAYHASVSSTYGILKIDAASSTSLQH